MNLAEDNGEREKYVLTYSLSFDVQVLTSTLLQLFHRLGKIFEESLFCKLYQNACLPIAFCLHPPPVCLCIRPHVSPISYLVVTG